MLNIVLTSISMFLVFVVMFFLTYLLRIDFKYKVMILDTLLIVMFGTLYGIVMNRVLTVFVGGIL